MPRTLDDSSFIEARESVKNKDMGFYSDSEEVSDIGHETGILHI